MDKKTGANKKPPIEENSSSRRAFLKKMAYSTPVLIALGQMARPASANADESGGPDGPPGGWTP